MDARVLNFSSLPIILGLIAFGLVQICSCFRCGIPQIRHEALIVSGNPTRQGEWPWHAAIYHRINGSEEYACGGTLINHHFVLTAAHCTVNQNTGIKLTRKGLFVRLGVHCLNEIDTTRMQQYSVEDIHTFRRFSRENMRNDIALLKLGGSVQITDYVVPACINRQLNLTNAVGTSVGWGFTENDKISQVLKMARLPVIDDMDCLESDRDLFGRMLHKKVFCAGLTNGTSMCNGDSGGGLFFKRGDAWYLGGIVSFTKFREHGTNICYSKGYTVFTKVVKYLPWISNITGIYLGVGEGIKVNRQRASNILRLSDEKCLEYQQTRKFDWRGKRMANWNVYIKDQGVQTCWANIISERYLLSTGRCFYRTLDKASFTAVFYTLRNTSSLSNLKPILHPNQTVNAGGYVPEDSIILIDLGQDHVELKPYIACLWTDPNKITNKVFSTTLGISGKQFTMREMGDGKIVTSDRNIPCDIFPMQGRGLMLQKVGEDYQRMVGPLINCEPFTYVRLSDYLDWIEETVWPGEA